MFLSIRELAQESQLSEHLAFDALGEVVTPGVIEAVIGQTDAREERVRKLPASVMLVFCIAMNLLAAESLSSVFARLVRGLKWSGIHPNAVQASKSALCQARYRLGERPLIALFHQVCRPLATPTTKGAFIFGLLHVAIDAQTLDLPDTAANERHFGRPTTARGLCAFPQAYLVGLLECATHAFFDATLVPYPASLHQAAQRLVRSITHGMLVSFDCGLHSYPLIRAIRTKGAHVLSRLSAGVRPQIVKELHDGSVLARIFPSSGIQRRQRALLVRMITYTFDDPNRPGYGEVHRLLTTLLDPTLAPAKELIVAYHNRWEYELAVDEVETHLRPRLPLRSKLPAGIIQEVYGLLIAHYLVRKVMHDAAVQADLPPIRLSFLETVRLLRDYLPDFQRHAPQEQPFLYQALLDEVKAAKLPPRANRINPRVVKRKMSNFNVKRPCHKHWPQPTKAFQEAIVLLI
ncbi:MAG TPA: IS4 family transposase [bacterium]|nr:IS4 family transposase [bacterium]